MEVLYQGLEGTTKIRHHGEQTKMENPWPSARMLYQVKRRRKEMDEERV
jgi:hypothetical protein